MNARRQVTSGTPPTRVPLPSAQRGSLTTSCLGFPLSTELASPDHRGVTCREAKEGAFWGPGRSLLPVQVGSLLPHRTWERGSGRGQERESRRGQTEVGGKRSAGGASGRGSHRGVWLEARPGTEHAPFTEWGNSSPTTITRKGQSRKPRHRIETLFSKRLFAKHLVQDEVFANQFLPGLHSREDTHGHPNLPDESVALSSVAKSLSFVLGK